MRVNGAALPPAEGINIELSRMNFVDNTISRRGQEPAPGWYYIGGVLEGDTFRAMELTGGIAENTPDACLVDSRVCEELGLFQLPSSTVRNPALRAVVDKDQDVMAASLTDAVANDLEKDK